MSAMISNLELFAAMFGAMGALAIGLRVLRAITREQRARARLRRR